MDYKKLFKYRGRKAISPIVATLILIIIAIVGAVSVGLIMSGIASSTSKAANPNTTNAATQLLVGGSTTLYPAVLAAATAYNAANGVNIVVQQGGSGAGMEGVAEGVLAIGTASSYSAVASAISEYPTANLQAVEVGGSSVVFIVDNGANTPTSNAGICGAANTAAGQVFGVDQAALQTLFGQGTAISATCTANVITAFGAAGTSGCTPSATCITAVSRSDLPSGTEDTACAYLLNVCASTSNNAVALPGLTEVGDSGLLSEVSSTKDTVGFTDIGFAEGASTTPGSTTAVSGVTVLSLISTSDTTFTTPQACSTFSSSNAVQTGDCYALPGTSTAALDSYIKASLNVAGGTSSAPVYPDATSGTGLTRTFWMVTSGTATTTESQFLTYIRSPAATSFWNNAGYYSLYQLTPITPP